MNHEPALADELTPRGIDVERQRPTPLSSKGLQFEEGNRTALLVAREVVVEPTCPDPLLPAREAQVISDLKLRALRSGPLIDFKMSLLKHDVRRFSI